MSIEDGITLAYEIYRGEGPTMDTKDQKVEVAELLVNSDAFTLGQAATIVGISKTILYNANRKNRGKARENGKRTGGGVAGFFNPEDSSRVRFIRHHMMAHEKGTRISDNVRGAAKAALENGTSPTVLAHLTGLNVHTLRQVKAGRMW